MGDDNVTPFRRTRPPQKRPGPSGGGLRSQRGQVLLMHGLTLTTFVLFLVDRLAPLAGAALGWLAIGVGVAALAIAASRRDEGLPWTRTHHEMGLRTIVIGGAVSVLVGLVGGLIPGVGLVALIAQLAILGWVLLRAGVGFGRGAMRLPMSNPRSALL